MASTRARNAIDAMGGDHDPDDIVVGAIRAQAEVGVEILLVGDPQAIEASLQQHAGSRQLEIVPAEDVVAMDEEPLVSLKRKPKASINVAMDLVLLFCVVVVVSVGFFGVVLVAVF